VVGADVSNWDDALRKVESDASDEEVSTELGMNRGDVVSEGGGDEGREALEGTRLLVDALNRVNQG